MSEVGALIIKLQAETAEFRSDLGKVQSDLDNLKGGAEKTGESFNNIGEARGGLMLVEESVGVRLPRHLNSLIAQIPGVGALFAAMLPIVGVVVAIEIIGKLIEHHEALAAAIRKAAEENENSAIKEADQTKALELTNLKLDDQIAKLEKKPSHNYMKEAILETSEEIDKLAASFASDFAKMNSVLETHLSFWHEVGRGIEDAFSGVGQGKGYGTGTEELKKLQDAMQVVEEKRRAMADAPMTTEAQKAAQNDLIGSLHGMQSELDANIKKFADNKEMVLQFSTAAAQTSSEIKDLNLAMEAGGKKQVIAGLEQAKPDPEQAKIMRSLVEEAIKDAERIKQLHQEVRDSITTTWEDLQRENEKDAQKQIESAEKVSKAQTTLAEATAKLDESEALKGIKGEEDANEKAHALGLESERKYIAEKIRITEEELAAKKTALETEIALQQQAADTAGGLGNNDAAIQALAKKAQLQTELNHLTAQYGTQLSALNGDLAKLDSSWGNYFKKMKSETMDLSTTVRTTLQKSVTQFTESFAQGMAKCIVENKSLGTAVRQEAAQMLEAMISMLAQEVEKTIVTDAIKLAHHLGLIAEKKAADTAAAATTAATAIATDKTQQVAAAGLAGANMMASFSAAPWPIDAGAPAAASAAFTAALAFADGGIVPGAGTGDSVPAMLSPGETVVSRAITDQAAANHGSVGKGGGDTHNHLTYAPQVSAIDSDGVEKMLKKHATTFNKHITANLRKQNKRAS